MNDDEGGGRLEMSLIMDFESLTQDEAQHVVESVKSAAMSLAKYYGACRGSVQVVCTPEEELEPGSVGPSAGLN